MNIFTLYINSCYMGIYKDDLFKILGPLNLKKGIVITLYPFYFFILFSKTT